MRALWPHAKHIRCKIGPHSGGWYGFRERCQLSCRGGGAVGGRQLEGGGTGAAEFASKRAAALAKAASPPARYADSLNHVTDRLRRRGMRRRGGTRFTAIMQRLTASGGSGGSGETGTEAKGEGAGRTPPRHTLPRMHQGLLCPRIRPGHYAKRTSKCVRQFCATCTYARAHAIPYPPHSRTHARA
jgi:hypothetical protein